MIFDSHAHYDDEAFDKDRDCLLSTLEEQGVGCIVNVGASFQGAKDSVELSMRYPHVYAAVGVHPDHVGELDEVKMQHLREMCTMEKTVAVGEIGLDYYWKENEPKEVQKRIFLEQVDLAKQFDLPVIIHDRDAHGDMLELFQKEVHGVQAVFHCFSGSLEMAKELAKRGYYFGFGGTSTYKNAKKVREVMQYIPKELLLFETDSPYLTPVPFRGKRNNPGYTEYTARNAAQVLGMEFEELAAIATANTKRLFKKIK